VAKQANIIRQMGGTSPKPNKHERRDEHRKALPQLPFSLCDRGAYLNRPWVAVERMGREYLAAIYYSFSSSLVEVAAVGIHEIDTDWQGRKQFYVDGFHTGFGPTGLAQTHLQWLKTQALRIGARPDAIGYLKSACKLTKEECEAMGKAATKTKPAKAAKGAKPVGGGGKLGGGSKGNAAGLAKAREKAQAQRNELAEKKLKINVTAKQASADDFKLRGGRLQKLLKVIDVNPKTVGAALDIGEFKVDKETHKIDMGALRGMEKRGHVTIG
jgi:hypothetical protein